MGYFDNYLHWFVNWFRVIFSLDKCSMLWNWFNYQYKRCSFYRFSQWPWKSCDICNNGTKWLCFGFVQLGSICSSLGLNVLNYLNLDSNEPFHYFYLPFQNADASGAFSKINFISNIHCIYERNNLKSQCVFAPNFLQ